MSNKAERRQERLRAERERERELAITTPRHPHDQHWGFFAIGELRLQLVHRVTFQGTICYEVRNQNGPLRLFRSASADPGQQLVIGYERVVVEPEVLGRLLRAVDGLSIPVRTRPLPIGVLDGETYELAAFGGIEAASRFSWRGGHAPEAWAPLTSLVESAIADFDGLPGVDEIQAPRSVP